MLLLGTSDRESSWKSDRRIQERMQQLLVEEVTEFLGRTKYQRRGWTCGAIGTATPKPRRLTMRSEAVTVRRPQVERPEGTIREPTVPLFTRRNQEVRDLLPDLYLHGLASGDFELALREPGESRRRCRRARWHG